MTEKVSNKICCPLCGSSSVSKEMECKDCFVSGEIFPIYECSECGFRFTAGVPDDSAMGRYYQSAAYISHSDTGKGLMNKVYHMVRMYMLREKCNMVMHFTGLKHGTLLDYGTGTGYFAHSMSERGWNVESIEMSENARTFAFEHFGLRSKLPSDMDTLADHSFDCVTLWHVMEHVSNMHEMMDAFRRILKDTGLLVMAVPNRTSYDAQHYGERWAAYDVPRHLWHFSPSTMQRLGNDHGFALVEMIPMPFDAFYISMMTEKNYGAFCPFLKGLWYGSKAWLHTLGNKERSSSLIYIFKNK